MKAPFFLIMLLLTSSTARSFSLTRTMVSSFLSGRPLLVKKHPHHSHPFRPFRIISKANLHELSSFGRPRSTSSSMRSYSTTSSASFAASNNHVTDSMECESEKQFDAIRQFFSDKEKTATTASPRLLDSPAAAAQYMDEHEIGTVMFDCDGVLYRSPNPAPGAADCLQHLLHDGVQPKKQLFFVTNNSMANRVQLRDKLTQILNLPPDLLQTEMMISTSFTAAQYLKQQLLLSSSDEISEQQAQRKRRVYVIGSEGLRSELQDTGFEVLHTNNDDETAGMTRDELANYDFNALGTVDAVVVGHDTDFSFRKLSIATVLLQQYSDALFVATNYDAFDLVGAGEGRRLPGTGSLVAAVEFAAGRAAVDCGKPSTILADLIQDLYHVNWKRAMFVGDRLDTDMVFAKNTGMHAALVLTGVTTAQTFVSLDSDSGSETKHQDLYPTVIVPHVGYFAGKE